MKRDRGLLMISCLMCCGLTAAGQSPAQPAPAAQAPVAAPAGRGGGRGGPAVVSPQIEADGRVTFRLLAPNATNVTVGGDINGSLAADPNPTPPPADAPAAAPAGRGGGTPAVMMTKGENGIWSGTTVRRVKPGAWRYTFNVDGATVVDARHVNVSPTQTQVQSVLYVPGDFSETRDVPHGTVGLVRYVARSLGSARREMYVYLPPGYEKGTSRYPVLYLIHGGGDTAISWSTVGRANNILDNLLAEKKALPMIVVMPSGWTPSGGQVMTADATRDPFNDEMLTDIIPFVEANYRTLNSADARALSGLSMGGIQTLNIGLTNLEKFRWLGVFSSGWFPGDLQAFDERHGAALKATRTPPRLFWMAHGATDIAKPQSEKVIAMLEKHGMKLVSKETPGGHTWANWRDYLRDFAPLLFR